MKLRGWGGSARRWYALAGLSLGYLAAGYTSYWETAAGTVAAIAIAVFAERADKREREKAILLVLLQGEAEEARRVLEACGVSPYRSPPTSHTLDLARLVSVNEVTRDELLAALRRLARYVPAPPIVPDDPTERSE